MEDKHREDPQKDDDDDILFFEEMEQNFNTIVRELVTDRSLDKFREEYEKLHEAIIQAHDHNTVLSEKCRQLNQDILTNANKISTVLTMSQNDQRKISSLRSEFEKSWKMVEMSQNRESKSKDVIISLREDISNLNDLIKQSSNISTSQETSIQESNRDISLLKNEIQKNEQTRSQMFAQIQTSKEQIAILKPQNIKLNEEFKEMTKQRANYKEERKTIRSQMNDAYKGMDDTREIIAHSKETVAKNEEEKSNKSINIKKMNNEFNRTQKDIKNIKDDTEEIKKRIYDKSVERDTWLNKVKTMQSKVDEKIQQSELQEQKSREYSENLKKIDFELSLSNEELKEEKANRVRISKEHADVVKEMNDMRNSIYSLESQLNSKLLLLRVDKENIEMRNKEKRQLVNSYEIEKNSTKTASQGVELVSRDCSSEKMTNQHQRSSADKVDVERQVYAGNLTVAENNIYQIYDDIYDTQKEVDKLTIRLGEINDEITRQGYLCDAMRGERDILCRMLQQWRTSNEEYESENKSLEMFLGQLKHDIKIQDQRVVDLHLNTKLLQRNVKQMEETKIELQEKLEKVNIENNKSQEEIEKRLLIEQEGHVDIKSLKSSIANLGSIQGYFGATMAKRQNEADLLNEKCSLVASEMRIAEKHFFDKLAEVEDLKEKMSFELEAQRELYAKLRKRDLARAEMLRLEKELNRAKGENHALETEAENPRNVHRWTILEATNPEQFQLLMLREDLLESIWTKLNDFSKARNRRDAMKERNQMENKKLMTCYGGSFQDDFTSMKEALKRKTAQLNQLSQKVEEKKPAMRDEREKCTSVRSLIRERKVSMNEMKHKQSEILLSSMDKLFEVKPPTIAAGDDRPPGRFIGGGFGVGAAQMTTVIPKLDLGRAKSDRGTYNFRNYNSNIINSSNINSNINNVSNVSSINGTNKPVPIVMPASARRARRPNKICFPSAQNRSGRVVMSARVPIEE